MNSIPQDEWNRRVESIMTKGINKETIPEAFTLYNDRLTPKETKLFCGGCRSRVWNKLIEYYNKCKTKVNQ